MSEISSCDAISDITSCDRATDILCDRKTDLASCEKSTSCDEMSERFSCGGVKKFLVMEGLSSSGSQIAFEIVSNMAENNTYQLGDLQIYNDQGPYLYQFEGEAGISKNSEIGMNDLDDLKTCSDQESYIYQIGNENVKETKHGSVQRKEEVKIPSSEVKCRVDLERHFQSDFCPGSCCNSPCPEYIPDPMGSLSQWGQCPRVWQEYRRLTYEPEGPVATAWYQMSGWRVPNNAIMCAKTRKGENVYYGRCRTASGELKPGKVVPAKRCCFYEECNRILQTPYFEVLVYCN